MIAEHPRCNVTGMSRAPLQLMSRCHIPGGLRRQIYSACRKDQKLLSPDTDVQNSPSLTEILRGGGVWTSRVFSAQAG